MPHIHGHDETDRPAHTTAVTDVRGGLSLVGILTGVAVALGAMMLLTAIVGGIAAAAGLLDDAATEDPVQVGWVVGAAIVIVQFLAYLWGGYTSGRMARGIGWLNGLLVPVAAIVLALVLAGIVAALGTDAEGFVAFRRVRVATAQGGLLELTLGVGIASLVAMFLGAIIGGIRGANWHDRLEARVVEPGRPDIRAA